MSETRSEPYNHWNIEPSARVSWSTRVHFDLRNELLRDCTRFGFHRLDDSPIGGDLAAVVAYYDASGDLVENEIADLATVVTKPQGDTRCPPLTVGAHERDDEFIELRVFSRSDIWLPWCSTRWEEGAHDDDLADNRELAARNASRLNAFLAHISELAVRSGHRLTLSPSFMWDPDPGFRFELDDTGVRLDADNPRERNVWKEYGDGGEPDLAEALMTAADSADRHPEPEPYRTVIGATTRNNKTSLFAADRELLRDVLRVRGVGDRLLRSPQITKVRVRAHDIREMVDQDFSPDELVGAPDATTWREHVLAPGGGVNRWNVDKESCFGWIADIDESLLLDVLRAGEEHAVFQVQSVEQLGYDRRLSGLSYPDFLLAEGVTDHFKAFKMIRDSHTARLAYFDPSGRLVEQDVADLGSTLAAGKFLGRARTDRPPLRLSTVRSLGTTSLFISSYSDIWLPWCAPRDGGYFDDVSDNRLLATRHTPRLNAFLAEIEELAERSGGRMLLDVQDLSAPPFEVTAHGVALDVDDPKERYVWQILTDRDERDFEQFLLDAAVEADRKFEPPPYRTALALWIGKDGPLDTTDRHTALAVLRAYGLGDLLDGRTNVVVRNGYTQHYFTADELVS